MTSPTLASGWPAAVLHQRVRARRAAFVLTLFVLGQLACQVGLLFPALVKGRVAFRSAAFVTSLVALVLVRGRGRAHPSSLWAAVSLGILGLGLFHPNTNSTLAALAQIALYLAILAPIFWVPRLGVTGPVLTRLVALLWLYQSASAGLGVLQMYYPGRFQPALSDVVASSPWGKEIGSIVLASGEKTYRPMGLTDTPGGAALSGLSAVLFGLGFVLASRNWAVRAAAAASVFVGLFCIYMAQVRSILVMAGVAVVTLAAVLARRGEGGRVVVVAALAPVAAFLSFAWATSVGGEATSRRLQTLAADSPGKVYYSNRGQFLEATLLETLPRYPFGAGLGRWGMMFNYFGDKNAPPERGPLHVEIQVTAWVLDGGVPLLMSYGAALLTAVAVAYRIAVGVPRGCGLDVWAAIVFAYDVGILAETFNYAIFISQTGMEFWTLNAAAFAAAMNARRAARPAVTNLCGTPANA